MSKLTFVIISMTEESFQTSLVEVVDRIRGLKCRIHEPPTQLSRFGSGCNSTWGGLLLPFVTQMDGISVVDGELLGGIVALFRTQVDPQKKMLPRSLDCLTSEPEEDMYAVDTIPLQSGMFCAMVTRDIQTNTNCIYHIHLVTTKTIGGTKSISDDPVSDADLGRHLLESGIPLNHHFLLVQIGGKGFVVQAFGLHYTLATWMDFVEPLGYSTYPSITSDELKETLEKVRLPLNPRPQYRGILTAEDVFALALTVDVLPEMNTNAKADLYDGLVGIKLNPTLLDGEINVSYRRLVLNG